MPVSKKRKARSGKPVSYRPRRSPPPTFPVRGTPGGYRDGWDDPDDHEELRIRTGTIERLYLKRATVLGKVWQGEIREERQQRVRTRKRRGSLW